MTGISRLRYFNPVGAHPSGTGVRDSLPVMNLGTGKGLSVLDVVQAFEDWAGIAIPYELTGRRDGDIPRLEGCANRASEILGWRATRSLQEMCRDGWAWQSGNPNGYTTALSSRAS